MPVQYSGIIAEHTAVREDAGVFDVSHMGEITVRGDQALDLLQKVTCNDVSKMQDGRCQYNGVLYPDGGFVDDVLVYRNGETDYLVVVNASNIEKDYDWIASQAEGMDVEVENVSDEYAQLAIQGPKAEEILARMTDLDLSAIGYYRFTRGEVDGAEAIVSRTGYTGEDGFEVYVDPTHGPRLFEKMLEIGEQDGILPCGLGARDTLRLEAKMALYGNDIDRTTTPLEADLGWMVKLGKGSFNGKEVLENQKESGTERKLVGFEMIDRGIARHDHPIVADGKQIGVVTSGSHSPTLNKAIGLAYLPTEMAETGREFTISVRGRELKARVVETPFYKRDK